LDPLLWLKHREGEPQWNSIHGAGRPGWHIECSVIALRYLLGEDFLKTDRKGDFLINLQGGGSDLIFPHHFMSGALAEALTGKTFAQTYLHAGMVGLDGEKMSKSKGNLVFVSKLLAQGREAVAIRHALLSSHYSSDRMWSDEILVRSENSIVVIREALARNYVSGTTQLIQEIIAALADDLDTPRALKAVETWAHNASDGNEPSGEIARALDLLLGLAL
jgi:L-cysteine:1D-myo-inositol 2-amino-2-deoxy-alpha-D-glucopyranoside ligase